MVDTFTSIESDHGVVPVLLSLDAVHNCMATLVTTPTTTDDGALTRCQIGQLSQMLRQESGKIFIVQPRVTLTGTDCVQCAVPLCCLFEFIEYGLNGEHLLVVEQR